MFAVSVWKFYYELMNGMSPPYFNFMIPELPNTCNRYELRKPLCFINEPQIDKVTVYLVTFTTALYSKAL